jgi:outer membrane immunogenic protein
MLKFLFSGVALAALAGQALAGDLPSSKDAPAYVPPPPVFTWTGFYAGVNAGPVWGDSKIDVVSTPVSANPNRGDVLSSAVLAGTASGGQQFGGLAGGGQVGYNYQMGSIVVGLEADIMGLTGNSTTMVYTASVAGGGSVNSALTATSQVDWLGTVRGRLGYTVTPTLLLYATGGLAYGGVNSSFVMMQNHTGTGGGGGGGGLISGASYGSASDTRVGWTVGGGLEYAFVPNWTLRVEYLYFDLGDGGYAPGNLVGLRPSGVPRYTIASSVRTSANGNIIRVGLNYMFGGPVDIAPVVAKY